MQKHYVTPNSITAQGIKDIRSRLGMTQREFSEFICVSKPTVERWEMGDKDITGPVALLQQIIMLHPEIAQELSLPEKKLPLRMYYYYKDSLCTVIDIDEVKRIVRIKNYAKNLMFRAFGVNESPTFEDYEEFIESRCFPRSRDKMKIMLEALEIPFYDPILIIEKTNGRMAEDDFWIKIER
ncbi:helix-turn-helix domain-containing protein [Butyrivibrio sp. YAB3001]|uniref:helix-turn-helix domain-containing protein n=1 Tax=Butyrivibrio sp. YAB3001 TaxID=1520812 RepID=UPI0008F68BF6|nr:helix-turn-helix domain-containing protein [Butyrivibrio sp. YAB3001]SFC77015.1 putative transcriptional regulator [Butyrivibrio sp. YAB3001]